MTLATIIEVNELLDTVLYSSLAGIGITTVFSIAIYGMVRFADFSSDDRRAAAYWAAVLAVVGICLSVAVVVAGLVVMLQK